MSSSSSAEESDSEIYEVEKILDHREDSLGRRRFRIQWKGYPPGEDTWEDEDDLNCPYLLEEYLKLVKQTKKAVAPKGKPVERPIAVTAITRGLDDSIRYKVEYSDGKTAVLSSPELVKVNPDLIIGYLQEHAGLQEKEYLEFWEAQ
jgi:hypothetical protein